MKRSVYFQVKKLPYEREFLRATNEEKSLLRLLYDEHIPVPARVGYNNACAGNVEIVVEKDTITVTWNPDTDGRSICGLSE